VPRLSIVIVTYNSRAFLDGCLESIVDRPPAGGTNVVVVDNGSTDGTPAHVRERWPSVRLIETRNDGFAAGCNLGLLATGGELVLLLNPDTTVPIDAVNRLIARLDARPDAAVAGPRIVDSAGRAELSFGAMLSPLTEFKQKLLVRGHAAHLPIVSNLVDRLTRREHAVDWVSGACLLVRRADAEAVGGFDTRYFMYEEDVDFCAAIRARERTVLFTPAAQVVHHRGHSAVSRPAAAARAYHHSHLMFYEKHLPRWAPALRAWLRLTGKGDAI
jgi:N-acetylglucosaminyl-diphospho-decaprenol L-rhamnosyltransferase